MLRTAATGLCLALICSPAPAADWLPEGAELPAAYIVASGAQVIDSRAPSYRRQPASLAKLAGALVMLETARKQPATLDAIATVSKQASAANGTRLGLRAGDRVAIRDLLAAMLVRSANDACLALAEHLSGSGAKFTERMNALALRLKMADTRFADPCGFDQPGQHTTAADLLRLARAALSEPAILAIVEQDHVRVVTRNGGRTMSARSTNALLGRYEGVFGLKTGYTRQAGPSLIAAARRGDTTVIVVILGSRQRWPVTVALLDQAFEKMTGYPSVRSRTVIGEPDS